MANWNHCPAEVKKMIIDEFASLYPEQLIHVREANREIRSLANPHFGSFCFDDEYVLFNSESAVKKFKAMTSSPAIGPLIKKVVLSAIRVQPDGCNRWIQRLPVIEDHDVETGIDVYNDLKDAFSNVQAYGNSITIGITDVYDDEDERCLGWQEKLDSGDFSRPNVAADEVDAFDTITETAERAGVHVEALEVMLYPRPGCPNIEVAWGHYDFPSMMAHYLQRHPQISVRIETQIDAPSTKAINVVYEKDDQRLSIKSSIFSAVMDTWSLRGWMKKISLKELHLQEMQIKAENLKLLLSKSRTRTINKIDLVSCRFSSARKFKAVLQLLSTVSTLRNCTIATPVVGGSPDTFIDLLINQDDSCIKYTGNVAKQIRKQLESWEYLSHGMNNLNGGDSDPEEEVSEDEESEVED
ncbi:uncharacterized protein M437DRAFT_80318 [Aureobasidium melanogenum CBS 110374]|uniref:Uncharacterized protein n=1 Tax=Aureobasidium melanogenum (strain CBS 110374) TaxID=1043003 RepID=A0A074WZ80_AURM1|nr:uncharacterized protein M437DRAFT_80318 [Aureobasidium melanogenum CBS 110374]KEQ67676.1 hypothetical protein M437DRAFT_80318 [Aureobasidium melanogenum CBS 110374]